MAKKKKKTAKAPAKRKAPTKVRTAFMSAFTSEFIRDSKTKAWKWPSPTQTPVSILADFETFTDSLMRADVLLQPIPPDGSNSLSDRLAQFLLAQHWPVSARVPKKWQNIQPTVRLIEIAVIIDRLLEAINARRRQGGAGGGGEGWPPH